MRIHNSKQRSVAGAFSFIEVLVVIAAISTISAVGLFMAKNVKRSSDDHKLAADVAALNASVKVYEANGGDLFGLVDIDEVIHRLKSVSANAEEIAGLRGAFIDSRLGTVPIVDGDKSRALWDPAIRRFVIRSSGMGVGFTIEASKSENDYGSEKREVEFELAKKDNWIWDYKDQGVPARPRPGNMATVSSPAPEPDEPISFSTLEPPEFSLPGTRYPLDDYDLTVHIANPNPSSSSRILYSVVAGEWIEYSGNGIVVTPDTSIEAFAESLKPKTWGNSSKVLEYYGVETIGLQIALSFEKADYTYQELGGAMIPGTGPAGPLAAPGALALESLKGAAGHLESGNIELRYSAGRGSESLVSVLPGQSGGELPIDLSWFGTGKTAVVEARAASQVSYFDDSETMTTVLNASSVQLLVPEIQEQPRPDGLFVYGEHYVKIVLDTATGEIPENARIFYTTDGTDPGASQGVPTSPTAIEYTGPFLIDQPDGQPIKARVYAPNGATQWFEASQEDEIIWPLVANIGFTVTVSPTLPTSTSSQ